MQLENTKFSFKQAMFLVLVFLTARLGILAALNFASQGMELASDVKFHNLIISQPLAILQGTASDVASYPPFQWVIELPLYRFYNSFVSDMISYRLIMITVELLTFIAVIILCNKSKVRKNIALFILLLFIISPHQQIASVLLVQEDVIAQLFSVIAAVLLAINKRLLSTAVLSIGVITAKIFFVIPLFFIVMFEGRQAFRKRLLIGIIALIPIALVYFVIIYNAILNGGSVPLLDFTPDAVYASNYWVLLLKAYPSSLPTVKYFSLIITTFAQLCVLALVTHLYRKKSYMLNPALLIALPLATFFATFYQHMPEYLLMLWPLIALLYNSKFEQLLIAGALSFAWLPRIFHGLKNVGVVDGSAASARSEVLGSALNSTTINFELLHNSALILNTVIFTALLASLYLKILKKT